MLLDAYGTLFHYEPDRMSDLFRRIVSELGAPTESETLLKQWRVHEDSFRRNRIWKDEDGRWQEPPPEEFRSYQQAWAEAFERACDDLDLEGGFAEDAVAIIVQDLRSRDVYRDVPPALDALRARVPLALLSNADRAFLFGTLEHNGIAFDSVTLSEQERVYKPHPRIFARALQALGIDDPKQALYVGDSPREDIVGPHDVGMPAVWVNRTGADWPLDEADRPEYEVRDLLGLVDIVGSRTMSLL